MKNKNFHYFRKDELNSEHDISVDELGSKATVIAPAQKTKKESNKLKRKKILSNFANKRQINHKRQFFFNYLSIIVVFQVLHV